MPFNKPHRCTTDRRESGKWAQEQRGKSLLKIHTSDFKEKRPADGVQVALHIETIILGPTRQLSDTYLGLDAESAFDTKKKTNSSATSY